MSRPETLAEVPWTPTSHDPLILKRVMIAAGAVPGLMQLSQSTLEPGQRVQGHAHRDLWEVFLVRAGTVEMTIDGATHTMSRDQWIVVPPPVRHGVSCLGDAPAELLVIAIAGDPPSAQSSQKD